MWQKGSLRIIEQSSWCWNVTEGHSDLTHNWCGNVCQTDTRNVRDHEIHQWTPLNKHFRLECPSDDAGRRDFSKWMCEPAWMCLIQYCKHCYIHLQPQWRHGLTGFLWTAIIQITFDYISTGKSSSYGVYETYSEYKFSVLLKQKSIWKKKKTKMLV